MLGMQDYGRDTWAETGPDDIGGTVADVGAVEGRTERNRDERRCWPHGE